VLTPTQSTRHLLARPHRLLTFLRTRQDRLTQQAGPILKVARCKVSTYLQGRRLDVLTFAKFIRNQQVQSQQHIICLQTVQPPRSRLQPQLMRRAAPCKVCDIPVLCPYPLLIPYEVYQPSAGYKTITTYYTVPAGSASTAYISTISSAYQSSSGTIGCKSIVSKASDHDLTYLADFYPSATGYVTVHTTVGSASSTYTVQPSGTVSGTVVQGVPAATQAACYNQGTSWAYWNNSQGANDGSGYKSFDPTLYKKMKPIYNSTTSLMGGISQAGTSGMFTGSSFLLSLARY
jgi:hypothetical protein